MAITPFRVIQDRFGTNRNPIYTSSSHWLAAADFAHFFQDKVSKIHDATAAAPPPVVTERQVPPLSSFEPVSEHELATLLCNSPSKSYILDATPTWLLKHLSLHVTPVICHLCNLLLQSDIFPSQLKQARGLPLIKKPTLDPDTCSSCRPISNLSFISKLLERVIIKRFTTRVSDYSLFPSQQSLFCTGLKFVLFWLNLLSKFGCHGNSLGFLEILYSIFEVADTDNLTIHAKKIHRLQSTNFNSVQKTRIFSHA